MAKDNIFYASLVFGAFYFPVAAGFYLLSGESLTYKSNRFYRLLMAFRHGEWYEERLGKTVDYLRLGKGISVLEVGCGPGKFSKRLLEAGTDLKAIDVNEKFINKLRMTGGDNFDLCSVTDLAYGDGRFDRVVMFDVLHHLLGDDYGRALSEIRRVLKPGGFAIIWEGSESLGEESLPDCMQDFLLRVFDGETNDRDLHDFQEEFGLTELEPFCYKMAK